ncbi:MAG: signal peptide peptidase SppA [Azospirillaceae bacterium]|nr:signal peptide peptidase SppA [Azospirillaceae bacterium]
MLRFLVRLFAVIGLLVVVTIVSGLAAWQHFRDRPTAVPRNAVLTLALNKPLRENTPDTPFSGLLGEQVASLHDIVEAIDQASRDPRVKALKVRLGAQDINMAKAQELRDAVLRFRAAGKRTYAFADSFGELSPANRSYYLASAFEQIWLQPVGMLGLTGTAAEVPFARRALDKLGLDPQLDHREQYKSAMDSLTESDFTPANREMVESLTHDLNDQLLAGIAEGRHIDVATLRGIVDRGPFTADEAKDLKLIDHIGYDDELQSLAIDQAGSDADDMNLLTYADAADDPMGQGPTVALIFGVGTIARGESHDSGIGGNIMGADTVAKAFNDAADDDDVKAILFRINSGGGSAVASETIRHAVQHARDAGKPVVVSMGDMAGSGGYWIAMNADRIVAQPGSLTGSIGVFAGKIVTSGLWQWLGINWGRIDQGANADFWSDKAGYTDAGHQRLEAALDDIYGAFKRNVAQARKLPADKVEDIAKGRVWTGSQAKTLGLVDALGGMETALAQVREVAGLPAGSPISLEEFPEQKSPFEQIKGLLSGDSGARSIRELATGMAGVALESVAQWLSLGTQTLQTPPTGLVHGVD